MDLLALPFLSSLAPFAIGGGIATAALAAWYLISPKTATPFIAARVDFICRLWRFAGPRLTDRGFITMLLANFGLAFGVGPEKLGAVGTMLWIGANLLFPLWDNHPAGQKLDPARNKLKLDVLADDDRAVLGDMLAEWRRINPNAGAH